MQFRRLLILGGVRSGKSRFAQELAEQSGRNKVFLATGEPRDDEMTERIALHRRNRGDGWMTVETPLELPTAIRERGEDEAVIVDCLTLWLTNILLAERDVRHAVAELEGAIREARCALVLVSNEVGMGIVPESALGRQFRDWQGKVNQAAAMTCDGAVFMVSGCPLLLKPAAVPEIGLA